MVREEEQALECSWGINQRYARKSTHPGAGLTTYGTILVSMYPDFFIH